MFRLAGTVDRVHNLPERLDELGWCVAHLLVEKGYYYPGSAHLDEMLEMTGKAVVACFPDMDKMSGFARSTHYQINLAVMVEKVAYAYIVMHGVEYFRKMTDVQNDLYERRVQWEQKVQHVRSMRNDNNVFQRRYATIGDSLSYQCDERVSRRFVRVAKYVRRDTNWSERYLD